MNEKQSIVEKIISIEWEMFISVNEGEEKASCQEDWETFSGMRMAQFKAWSHEALASYLSDLEKALSNGSNLVEAKYIHMMKTTQPARYEALLSRIIAPGDNLRNLAKDVSDRLLEQTRLLFEDYPYIAGQGRPLYSTSDYANTSVETYQLSEMLTYSEKTLIALGEHISSLEKEGLSLARLILENTVEFYGFSSLDTAEASTKEQVDAMEIEVSFGCDCEDEDE